MALTLLIDSVDQTDYLQHKSLQARQMSSGTSSFDCTLIGPSSLPPVDGVLQWKDGSAVLWEGVVTGVTTDDFQTVLKYVHVTASNETDASIAAASFGLSDDPDNSTTYGYSDLSVQETREADGLKTRISLKMWQPGLSAGNTVELTNALHGWSAEEFALNEIATTYDKNDSPVYKLTLGDVKVKLSTLITDTAQSIADSEFPIDSTKITDGAVTTPKLAANAVTADKISAVLVLASLIKTADSGNRVELDPNGFRAYDAAGDIIVNIPTDDSPVYVRAELDAVILNAIGAATMGGGLVLPVGAVMTLTTSQADPVVKPSLATSWDSISMPADSSYDESGGLYRPGLDYDDTGGAGGSTKVFWTVSGYSDADGHGYLLELLASDRTVNRAVDLGAYASPYVALDVCRLGSYVYVLVLDDECRLGRGLQGPALRRGDSLSGCYVQHPADGAQLPEGHDNPDFGAYRRRLQAANHQRLWRSDPHR